MSRYWEERFAQLEAAANREASQLYADLEEQYRLAQKDIQQQIEAWYQRFANGNQISIQQAKQWLTTRELDELRWDIDRYIKYGKENALTGQWIRQLENASARFHISRLEALQLQTQQVVERLYGNQGDEVDSLMRRIYTDGYYHTLFEVQKGFHIGWDVGAVDEEKLRRLLVKPWAADGKNFSQRIWQSKASLIQEVHTQLTQTCLLGKSPDSAIGAIAKRFDVSKAQAGRLVMTESAFFSSVAQQEAFQQLEVEQYEVVATLDSKTSPVCQEMDGKVFSMKDFKAGITAPPFHVWCRSCTVPYFEDDFTPGQRAARGTDGKTYYVPDNMKYPEWKEKFIEGGTKDGLKPFKKDGIINTAIDCGTFAEFETFLTQKYGIGVEAKLSKLNLKAVTESTAGVERVLKEFPVAKQYLKGLTVKSNGLMSCSFNGEISFHPVYYKTYPAAKAASSSVSGFHPKNTGIFDNGVHECAHLLEAALVKRNPLYVSDYQRKVAWSECVEARAVVTEALAKAKKTEGEKALQSVEYRRAISEYALKDESECMAEAVSDYLCNGKKAALLSKLIYDILKERMK